MPRRHRSARPEPCPALRVALAAALAAVASAGCATAGEEPDHHEATEGDLFAEAWSENQNPKSDASTCSGVVVPDRGPFGKQVALTFDDGPNPVTTRQVMATLRAHRAPATFFINGNRVQSAETRELAAEIAADPLFILANHSHSHPDLRTLSAAGRAEQIDRTTEVIRAAGEAPRYFRFPFGAATCDSAAQVRQRGYAVTGWHVDTADWCFQAGGGRCPEATFKHVPAQFRGDMVGFTMSQVRARQGGVILFHDIHGNTANQLEAILAALEAEGYGFVGLDDASRFPLLNGGVAPPPGPFIGDPCDGDDDCGFAGGFCVGDDGEVGRCTQACTTSCPDRSGKPTTRCVLAADPDAPADGESPLCLLECGPGGSCPAPLACGTLTSPGGTPRQVCW
jgi:peptidoglycan-N-acetylglucosamine deacetylase